MTSIILQQQTHFEQSSWIPILSKHCRQKRCKKENHRSICLLNTNYRPQHRVMHIPVMRSDDYSHSFSWSQKTISYQAFINNKTYELNRWYSIDNKKIIKLKRSECLLYLKFQTRYNRLSSRRKYMWE